MPTDKAKRVKIDSILCYILGLNTAFYEEAYPDLVGLSQKKLILHYARFGWREKRVKSWKRLARNFNKRGIDPRIFQPLTYLALLPRSESGPKTPEAASIEFIKSTNLPKRILSYKLPEFIQSVPSGHSGGWGLIPENENPTSFRSDNKYKDLFSDQNERILEAHSDVELIVQIFQNYAGYTPDARQVDWLCTNLDFHRVTRIQILCDVARSTLDPYRHGLNPPQKSRILNAEKLRNLREARSDKRKMIEIMGIPVISHEEWFHRAFDAVIKARKTEIETGMHIKRGNKPKPQISTGFRATAICSLYRTDEHSAVFLESIKNQTIFSEIEFIFILVNPTNTERIVYADFASQFANVKLHIFEERIGIYAAWNFGIEQATSGLLTNMNVDDIRSAWSLQYQVELMEMFGWIDVLYQDVHVTLSPGISWDEIEEIESVLRVPQSKSSTFMSYKNPPHNAPMWRKRLHEELGYFDTNTKSAGDFDFWMRCSAKQKVFYQTHVPHAAYFENPIGLSTAENSPGLIEGRNVINEYSYLLIYPDKPSYALKPSDGPVYSRSSRLTLGKIEEILSLDPELRRLK